LHARTWSFEAMKRILTDKYAEKPRILFVYEDKRATYLVEELRKKMPLIDVFHVTIIGKNL
jgi:hypothetical protein